MLEDNSFVAVLMEEHKNTNNMFINSPQEEHLRLDQVIEDWTLERSLPKACL